MELTVHATLDVKVMAKLPSNGDTLCVVGVTAKFGVAWVTVTVRVSPFPLKVRIPVRAAPVLAV